MLKRRRSRQENDVAAQNNVAVQYSERLEPEDSTKLIEEEGYVTPNPVFMPERNPSRKASRKQTTKREATSDAPKNKMSYLSNQYSVLLPLGQGKSLVQFIYKQKCLRMHWRKIFIAITNLEIIAARKCVL